ncbi:hypothetical protein HYFRA_00007254 [Hymenoscyphus fraxineus]|uniref:Uncharacterized protein n=1 Tax=Hymenoscyphus fraxineus TaxID=746836 RepID=A0A9N9PV55_9HELO|nr:hypothetical protein HYFRA_00007254 [Hymenoscyphus fraxineus]
MSEEHHQMTIIIQVEPNRTVFYPEALPDDPVSPMTFRSRSVIVYTNCYASKLRVQVCGCRTIKIPGHVVSMQSLDNHDPTLGYSFSRFFLLSIGLGNTVGHLGIPPSTLRTNVSHADVTLWDMLLPLSSGKTVGVEALCCSRKNNCTSTLTAERKIPGQPKAVPGSLPSPLLYHRPAFHYRYFNWGQQKFTAHVFADRQRVRDGCRFGAFHSSPSSQLRVSFDPWGSFYAAVDQVSQCSSWPRLDPSRAFPAGESDVKERNGPQTTLI